MKLGIHTATAPEAPPTQGYASWWDLEALSVHYEHVDSRHGVHFHVRRLPFELLQVLDTRLLTITPRAVNEKHRMPMNPLFWCCKARPFRRSREKRSH